MDLKRSLNLELNSIDNTINKQMDILDKKTKIAHIPRIRDDMRSIYTDIERLISIRSQLLDDMKKIGAVEK